MMATKKRFKEIATEIQKDAVHSTPSKPTRHSTEGKTTPKSNKHSKNTTPSKHFSKDSTNMKSDDVADDLSPSVKKYTTNNDSSNGRSPENVKKSSGSAGQVTNPSQDNNQSSAAIIPIQTRVDWVRLASFDHFEEDKLKYTEERDDTNPSRSWSSLSPDSDGSQAHTESKKLISAGRNDGEFNAAVISRDESPPPKYSAHDNRSTDEISKANPTKKKKGEAFTATLGRWDDKMQFTSLSPGSPRCRKSDSRPHQKLMAAARTVHASVRISRLERARRRAKWAGKKFIVFLVSHIGLTMVVLLYAVAGGCLFRWLEMDAETERRKNMKQVRSDYLGRMWEETDRLNVLHPVNWTIAIRTILEEYEGRIYRAITEGSWDAVGKEDAVTKWTIPGSLLFSTTVISTIGYGDITPRTVPGKMVCIVYAIIGIPLTLLCLANIGQLLAVSFKFFWRRMLECRNLCRYCNARGKVNKCDDSDNQQTETRIPFLVCVLIIVGYTLGGAAIFSSWETDWTFLDGFYFSFITLSTIGFGDFVPGQFESGTNERRVVCTLFVLLGLAVLSMCFQLMIDTARDITRQYAKIFGLTEEQIARDVQGLDNTVQIQLPDPDVGSPCCPETVIVVTPPGAKENDECATKFTKDYDNTSKKNKDSEISSNTCDDVIESGDDVIPAKSRNDKVHYDETEADALIRCPTLFISGDNTTRDIAESSPVDIRVDHEFGDFVSSKSDPKLPRLDNATGNVDSKKNLKLSEGKVNEEETSLKDLQKHGTQKSTSTASNIQNKGSNR